MAQILFPLFDTVILAPMHAVRAAALEDLQAAAAATGTRTVAAESVADAIRLARQHGVRGLVVISGSVYLVGEARGLLLRESSADGSVLP
jgi:dihydrofolate synthase/folylpolyglutamate synthase